MNVATLAAGWAERTPDAPCLVVGSGDRRRVIDFAEFDSRVAWTAGALRALGLGRGDVALVLQPMSVDLYVVLTAIFRLGAVAMFPDPSALREHIAGACRTLPPRLMIGSAKAHVLRLLVPDLRRVPQAISTSWPMPFAQRLAGVSAAPVVEPVAIDPDAPALVTFTSGSTGRPKGIVRSHRFLMAQHEAVSGVVQARPGTLALTTLPVFVLSYFASGVGCVLPDGDVSRPGRLDPGRLLEHIRANDVRQLILSPVVAEALAAAGSGRLAALDGVEAIFTGGGPVFTDTLAALARVAPGAAVHAAYGSSEAEPIAHIRADELSPDRVARVAAGSGLPTGSPVDGLDLAILPDRFGTPIGPFDAESFQPLPPGQAGEIVVAGPHVLGSYLHGHGDEETKFEVAGRLWHRTGDAGWIDQDGTLWLLGRCTARLRLGTRTLYPFSVEAALRVARPGLRVACLEHEGRPTLVMERADAAQFPDVPAFATGMDLRVVDRLPLDRRHNSKIDYGRLRALLGTVTGAAAVPPAPRRPPGAGRPENGSSPASRH